MKMGIMTKTSSKIYYHNLLTLVNYKLIKGAYKYLINNKLVINIIEENFS